MLPLKVSEGNIRGQSEEEGQFKPNITTIPGPNQLSNRSDEPHLGHSHRGANNATGKRTRSGNTHGQIFRLVVVLRRIPTHATLEDEMLRQRDALVNGKPVPNHQHEVLQDRLEVAVSRDRDRAVDDRADQSPQEARDHLGIVGQDLQREGEGVDVGTVVADNGEREDDDAELAEAA